MAFNFPPSPNTGDVYQQYQWNGFAWELKPLDLPGDATARLQVLEAKLEDIRNLQSSTGADGEPADYNLVVIDKATGQVRTIDPPDSIAPE